MRDSLKGYSVMIACCLLAAATGCRADTGDIGHYLEKVKKELKPLTWESSEPRSEALQKYLEFYGLDARDAEHSIGTFKSGTNTIAVNVFKPRKSRGTAMIVHGYCDHAGVWKHVIGRLVAEGYTVAVYDQPGHGLSTGERASIDEFSDYASVLDDFVGACTSNLRGPYHLLGHSMGGGIVINYLLTHREIPMEKIILIAPMIRSEWWRLSGFGNAIGGAFVDSVPRAFRKNSSDKEFLRFHENDPLQPRRVPARWVKAQRKWVKTLENSDATSDRSLLVIQGASDTTLAWKHNMKLLKTKFPNAEQALVEKGGHQLINEARPMRDNVLKQITDYLE